MAQCRFKNMSATFVKVKKAGKAAPPKLLTMVELKSDMDELYMAKATAM
jgi:hypothetical protein